MVAYLTAALSVMILIAIGFPLWLLSPAAPHPW